MDTCSRLSKRPTIARAGTTKLKPWVNFARISAVLQAPPEPPDDEPELPRRGDLSDGPTRSEGDERA
jgi:hypothetical protein